MKKTIYQKEEEKARRQAERQIILEGFKKGREEALTTDKFYDNIVLNTIAAAGSGAIIGRLVGKLPLPLPCKTIAALSVCVLGPKVVETVGGVNEAIHCWNEIQSYNAARNNAVTEG